MPASAEMNNSMQEFSDMNFSTSDQHQEASVSRKNKDTNDLKKLFLSLQNRSPFDSEDTSLRNIETGVTADTRVNVDVACVIGMIIIKT